MKDNIEIMNEKKMKEEIRLRMESDSWDFLIAHKVMEARTTKSEKTINIWSFASLATAAMSFIIFMASVYTFTLNNSTYGGTGSIYSYAYIKNDINLDNDILAAKLDLTINEAYPMR
jgi:aspartyl/asparaginyl-tRNA synthetase